MTNERPDPLRLNPLRLNPLRLNPLRLDLRIAPDKSLKSVWLETGVTRAVITSGICPICSGTLITALHGGIYCDTLHNIDNIKSQGY